MDLAQLADLGEFIGGVAVIVTLVYLAFQAADTRRQIQGQNYSTVFQTLYDAWNPAFDESNRELLHAGLSQERELSGSEQLAFTLIMGRILGVAQAIERADQATRAAVFPTVEFLFVAYPGGVDWAENARRNPAFGPSFAAFDRLALAARPDGSYSFHERRDSR